MSGPSGAVFRDPVPSATTIGPGGVDADAQRFVIATSDTPAGVDPNNILGSVTQDGDDITVTLDALMPSDTQDPRDTPDDAVYWETNLVNGFGDVTSFDLADLFRAVIRMDSLIPATDLWVGMALKSADNRGVAWRLAAVGGAWEVQHATKATSGGPWSSWTSSTANANTQGMQGGAILGNGTIQGRINASALDAIGTVMGGTATTAPSQSNIGNHFTKVRLCVGWIAGDIGAIPTTVTFKAGWIHFKLLDFAAMASFFSVSPATGPRSSQPTTFVIAGQSNAEGVTDDADWAGAPLQSGVRVVDRGVDLTTYPLPQAIPQNGPLPHLIKRALEAGAPTVNVVRRSKNGQNIIACMNTDLPLIVADLKAKGWTPDYWLLWQGEAETQDPAQSPAVEYEANLTKYCKRIFSHFPNCRVALMTLLMRTCNYGGPGASAAYPLIVSAQIAVAAAFPDRVLLVDTQVPSVLDMVDDVHASAGNGGGYDTGMSRFRDTWITLDAELVQPAVTPTPDIVSLRSDTAWRGRLHMHAGASADMVALADELNRILLKMTGQSIPIDNETTGAGILLGTFDEWAPDNYGFPGAIPDYISQGHDYIVVSEDTMVRILGVDVTAAEQGAFRLLNLLGYRALLPTDVWEVIPPHHRLTVRLSIGETPPLDFVNGMGDAGGLMPEGDARLDVWKRRNQIPTGGYGFGHVWGQIVLAYPEEFKNHPEYLGSSNKLCVCEPGVQALALDYVQKAILENSDVVVTRLTAADGTLGWDTVCTGTNEQAIYNPSDRQIILANYVQSQLDLDPETYRGVRIGILAYGSTSVPPTVNLHERLVVGVPNQYMLEGQTWEDVSDAYIAKGAADIIPYTYSGIWVATEGVPGKGRAANLSQLATDCTRAHTAHGTLKGCIAEGAGAWGPWGTGYWIMGRLLTDTSLTDPATLRDAYILVAFGDQAGIMAAYYDLILSNAPLTGDMLHRLYQTLQDALQDSPVAEVAARVYDLAIYVRYLELLNNWKGDGLVATFSAMIEWMWRARNTDLMGYRISYATSSWQPWFKALEDLYPGYSFTPFSAKPWNDAPFTTAELDTIILNGIAHNALLPFTPIGYSDDLVYEARPHDPRPRGSFNYANRNHSWYLWMREDQHEFTVTARGGVQNDQEGSAFLRIVEPETDIQVAGIEAEINTTGVTSVPLTGGRIYRVDIVAHGGVDFSWAGYAMTKITDFSPGSFQGDYSGYFYVPAGTTQIAGYCQSKDTRFQNPAGSTIHTTVTGSDYFYFSIAALASPEVWQVENANGTLTFLTVPPGLALHPDEVLLPRECVASQAGIH